MQFLEYGLYLIMVLYIAFNVAYNHWSGIGKHKIDDDQYREPGELLQFTGIKFIDILLDCDEGTLNIQLIDPEKESKVYPEIKCWDLPSAKNKWKDNDKFKGYVAQFNIGDENIEMELAKIPVEYYGVHLSNDIFEREGD